MWLNWSLKHFHLFEESDAESLAFLLRRLHNLTGFKLIKIRCSEWLKLLPQPSNQTFLMHLILLHSTRLVCIPKPRSSSPPLAKSAPNQSVRKVTSNPLPKILARSHKANPHALDRVHSKSVVALPQAAATAFLSRHSLGPCKRKRKSEPCSSTSEDGGFPAPWKHGLKGLTCFAPIRQKSGEELEPEMGPEVSLWQFLLNLLLEPAKNGHMLRWLPCKDGSFQIVDAELMARAWGDLKNNPNMDKCKFDRAMLEYMKGDLIKRVDQGRVYQFQFDFPLVLGYSAEEIYNLCQQTPPETPTTMQIDDHLTSLVNDFFSS
ncbi:hypothetical protein Ciccas_000439 [Cichlidogyrus casuarinus]|uniref:ETS domain-containing protein n=1 Tax=Cichlidogyrus casuarinus TaxID=1844966 RepID=A0ABD2QMV8_9PLAT